MERLPEAKGSRVEGFKMQAELASRFPAHHRPFTNVHDGSPHLARSDFTCQKGARHSMHILFAARQTNGGLQSLPGYRFGMARWLIRTSLRRRRWQVIRQQCTYAKDLYRHGHA
jgi:hypothetical protein